jgi:hypothetical protein
MNKRYTKDNKVYNTPIKIEKTIEYIEKEKNEAGEEIEVKKTKNVIQYTNVEKDILEAGYKVYVAPKISVETLVKRSNETINREIDRKILNDFVWKDNEFYLSMENQFNFKNLYDLRSVKKYPITIKSKTGFITLESAEEVEDFYISGVMFIEATLQEGWQKKKDEEEKIRSKTK